MHMAQKGRKSHQHKQKVREMGPTAWICQTMNLPWMLGNTNLESPELVDNKLPMDIPVRRLQRVNFGVQVES